jgi:outer membrane immunogenic protein
MRRLLTAVSLGLTALAIAGAASAADLQRFPTKAMPQKSPVYVGGFSWTGAYAGINGGYGWGKSRYDFFGGGTTGDFNVKGGLAGGTLGYNLQTGIWVWGIEGDFDGSWIKGSDSVCGPPSCETRNQWLATGRARLGFAADRALFYATGGVAVGSLKFTPSANPTETRTKTGWTAGGGVEYAVSGPWSVKAEYLYVDLGNTTCSAASCGGAGDSNVKFKASIARAGLNYRF